MDIDTYWKKEWIHRANNFLGLSQRMKDFEWLDKQIKKGRLSSEYRETIERIIPLLDAIYPDRWDIQFKTVLEIGYMTNLYQPVVFWEHYYEHYLQKYGYGSEEELMDTLKRRVLVWNNYSCDVYTKYANFAQHFVKGLKIDSVYIVIHFPEATVTNSNGESLVIKDIFTRTILYPNGDINSESLEGARATFSIAEVSRGYMHSHLKSVSFSSLPNHSRLRYSNFCLGETDLIDFARMYNESKNLSDLESYLYMLQTIVSWESIEGGPHMLMNAVIQRTTDIPNVSETHCNVVLNRLVERLYLNQCNIDWVLRDGQYCIVDNSKFEEFLRSAYSGTPGSPIAVYKDESGNYFTPDDVSETTIKTRYIDYIPFRGKKFHFKVEGELKLVSNYQWYINPKIKEYVKSKLERVCSKAQTKKYSLEWLNKADNNIRVS